MLRGYDLGFPLEMFNRRQVGVDLDQVRGQSGRQLWPTSSHPGSLHDPLVWCLWSWLKLETLTTLQ